MGGTGQLLAAKMMLNRRCSTKNELQSYGLTLAETTQPVCFVLRIAGDNPQN